METNTLITICGDICPTIDTVESFVNEDENKLFNDTLPILKQSDYLVGNLEFVLTDNAAGVEKTGPILTGKPEFANIFKNSEFDLLSLANNHIKDCGEEGVKNTMSVLDKYKIPHFGAGKNIREAKKPMITEINGLKVAFITFAEQEFNIATEDEYGANYFDPYDDIELIAETKKKVDFLFILYHGGIEYYTYPSPLLQKKCRKFVDAGADLVTCQHSHCIGTIEQYKSKSIVYGQGNTLFGYRKNNNSWNQGMLLNIHIDNMKNISLETVFIEAKQGGIYLMPPEKCLITQKELDQRQLDIQKENFIHNEWNKFCKKQEPSYFSYIFGFSRVLTHINRKFKNILISIFYNKKKISTTQNIIRCEAHNEVMSTILKEYKKSKS